MKTLVEFRSAAFPPYDGEEKEMPLWSVNDKVHGKRLAEFLAAGLKEKGFEPLEPIAEPWGWVVPIKNDGFKVSIGCRNDNEYCGYGHPDGFLCFIEPHESIVRRFFLWKVDTSAKVTALQEAIDQLLAANVAIRNKHWWSYEEFRPDLDCPGVSSR